MATKIGTWAAALGACLALSVNASASTFVREISSQANQGDYASFENFGGDTPDFDVTKSIYTRIEFFDVTPNMNAFDWNIGYIFHYTNYNSGHQRQEAVFCKVSNGCVSAINSRTLEGVLSPRPYAVDPTGCLNHELFAICSFYIDSQRLYLNAYGTVTGNDPRVRFTLSTERFNVPEPSTWALLIGGLGMAGAMLRRRRHVGSAYLRQ